MDDKAAAKITELQKELAAIEPEVKAAETALEKLCAKYRRIEDTTGVNQDAMSEEAYRGFPILDYQTQLREEIAAIEEFGL